MTPAVHSVSMQLLESARHILISREVVFVSKFYLEKHQQNVADCWVLLDVR